MEAGKTQPLRDVIVSLYPELAPATFTLETAGWYSIAMDVDDRLIFKFPRHEIARTALLKEAALLAIIRPAVSMPVPDLAVVEGPPLFSVHGKLQGRHLATADYESLPEDARRQLGDALGQFYAELHRLDQDRMARAGAGPIEPWQTPAAMGAKALPILPPPLRSWAMRTLEDFESLAPDPHGTTYGYFDGHGWNMAFDHARQHLNGLYDFADSGFGPLHQEFIYANFISPDLSERIVAAYEGAAGRALDRRRIAILTGIHRLSELAEAAGDPQHVPLMVRHVADWAVASGQLC
ncbi:MAG: aminoglycoside phosphotransferase family protein [Phyllobacterium sp.]